MICRHPIIYAYNLSHSCIQSIPDISLDIRQSPRGLKLTLPTLGPSGIHERLNCWLKKRRKNVFNQCFIVSSSYLMVAVRDELKAFKASIYIFAGLKPKRKK